VFALYNPRTGHRRGGMSLGHRFAPNTKPQTFVQPRIGRPAVVPKQRAISPPQTVSTRSDIRPAEGLAALRRMRGAVSHAEAFEATIARLARMIPTDHLIALADAGLLIHFEPPAKPEVEPAKVHFEPQAQLPFTTPTPRLVELLGERAATFLTLAVERDLESGGTFDLGFEVRMRYADFGSQELLDQAVCHELMHAIDLLLGHDGRYLSEGAEFSMVFSQTIGEPQPMSGRPVRAFGYMVTSLRECFAEAGSILVGAGSMEIRLGLRVSDEDFQRSYGDLRVHMERIMRELRAPDRRPLEQAALEVRNLRREIEADQRSEVQASRRLPRAILRALEGGLVDDRSILREALHTCDALASELSGEDALIAADLRDTIQTRLHGRKVM
jgi:hypothetical protein